MVKQKAIAITLVLVVIIAAVAAFLVTNKDDNDSKQIIDKSGRLMILGNADNNDFIDDDDIQTLRSIIKSGTWDREKYPYADANNDGNITESDIDITQAIIDKTVGRINYVNGNGEIKSSYYPINKFVSVGSFAINAMIVLNQDKCVGVSGSKTFTDELYWTSIQDIPKISNNAQKADYELVTKIDGVQTIFTTNTASIDEDLFSKADIDTIRLDFNGENELAAIMIMGFLINEKDKYLSIAEAYDEVAQKVSEVLSLHPEFVGKRALVSYNNLTIYSDKGAQGWMPKKIGLVNAWTYDSSKDDKEYVNAKNGDSEWYLNERFACDYIIAFSNFTYSKDASADNILSQMNQYFQKLEAFPEKTILFNSSIPQLAKTAYMLEGLFPEDVGVGYGNKVLQDYLNEFNPSFGSTYDVSKDGLFLVTSEEIKTYVESHPLSS